MSVPEMTNDHIIMLCRAIVDSMDLEQQEGFIMERLFANYNSHSSIDEFEKSWEIYME